MTAELALVLLTATLAVIGSLLSLLVTYDRLGEGVIAAGYPNADDAEDASLEWEWRLRMASAPEAYWY